MKILVPIAHSVPDRGTVGYVLNIVERNGNGKNRHPSCYDSEMGDGRGEIVAEWWTKRLIENWKKGLQR
ncbi:MAG: hypothetical protein LJE96_13170 [Deltaproteobacteria bacterium]|nr:hypothetical protein [Deltaproteobacteria bacterium]